MVLQVVPVMPYRQIFYVVEHEHEHEWKKKLVLCIFHMIYLCLQQSYCINWNTRHIMFVFFFVWKKERNKLQHIRIVVWIEYAIHIVVRCCLCLFKWKVNQFRPLLYCFSLLPKREYSEIPSAPERRGVTRKEGKSGQMEGQYFVDNMNNA